MTERRKEKRSAVDLKRLVVAAVALLMALLMVVPLVADVFLYGFAYDFTISQEDIDALVEQKEALAEQQAAAQATLDSLQDQEDSAVDRLNAIEDQLDLLAEQINATQEIIDQYDEMIAATQESLAEAQAQEEIYYELFLERVRSMEEEGTVSYWEILFNAASFSDLLDRWSFINDVMQYDNDIMDGLEAAQKAVASYETQLEEEQAAQEETKAQLLDEQAEQEDAAVEQQAIVAEILENQDTYAAQIAALSSQQNDLVGEISDAEAQLAEEEAAAALEEQLRQEEEERQRQEEEERQRQEEEERQRQEEEERQRQEEEERQRQEEEERQRQEEEEANTDDTTDNTTDDTTDNATDDTTDNTADDTTDDTTTDTTTDDTSNDTTDDTDEEDDTSSSSSNVTGASIIAYASQFVGNPYVWGGNSLTNGIDCSGFVHQVLAHFGISSPRYSGSFASWGKAVSVSDMQVGDVVVYSGHVGFYAGNGLLLSALGADYGITYCSVYYKSIVAVRRAW